MIKVIPGGVTAPAGFKAQGLFCGIKRSGKPDLSLIFSEKPAVAAGVFTKNSIKAAPLVVSQRHLRNHKAQAIIINSGNANCFTGHFGLLYARRTAALVAQRLKIKATDVLVASTGIIGKALPFKKIENAIPALVEGLSPQGGHKAALGILTTDKKAKEIAVEFSLNGKKVVLGGCAKGSGMIAPNMATMLAFIATDAALTPAMLKSALQIANASTFNNITVDGCMSTNDMVVVMANGLAGNKPMTTQDKNFQEFFNALQFVCLNLAKKIVLDGEGATKFIEIEVQGAKNKEQAKQAALAIANSNLIKAAAFGSNPNWGRVAAAVGSLGLKVTEESLKIKFSPFTRKHIRIVVNLHLGTRAATVYTCDLSLEYVRINGMYS
jgi:glutamate N-acetyltransferase/amino-acid N-acetyltransferase